MTRPTTLYLLAALTLIAAGCAKKEAPKPADTSAAAQPAPPAPLAVAGVDVGKAVDATKALTGATTTFGVRDTIYASVSTTGVGDNATLGAKWSFVKKDGSLVSVNESSQTVTTTGPANTEFHITKATPWPKGNYRVEIQLNGSSAGTKDFTVQ